MAETLPTDGTENSEPIPDDPQGYMAIFEELSYSEGIGDGTAEEAKEAED